ncbi:TPA: replication protein [Serratia marcescens]
MSTAEVIKFPRQPDKPGGQVADLENGYLRLANQIQDAVCRVELSGREFRVLNAVIRLTYGWSKKEDRITNSLIADKTGLAVKHVSEAVLTLAARRIIILRRIGQTRYIGINTELNGWAYGKPKCKSCVTSFTQISEENCYRIEITIPENGDSKKEPQAIPENGDNHPQKQGKVSLKTGNTKDILSKTDKHKDLKPPKSPKGESKKFDPSSVELPDWLDPIAWSEWVQYRAESKKPINSQLTVTKAFNVLKECLDEGHDPTEVINTSIASSYQGLFKPKYPARKQVAVTRTCKPMNHIPEGFTG